MNFLLFLKLLKPGGTISKADNISLLFLQIIIAYVNT